jgi:hypothetical protein
MKVAQTIFAVMLVAVSVVAVTATVFAGDTPNYVRFDAGCYEHLQYIPRPETFCDKVLPRTQPAAPSDKAISTAPVPASIAVQSPCLQLGCAPHDQQPVHKLPLIATLSVP